MKAFTEKRKPKTEDEIWIVEHDPVYTLGQKASPKHILLKTEIPIVKTDRGGEVTYHGPGQSVFYFLLDLKKRPQFFIKNVVFLLEEVTLLVLSHFQIKGERKKGAPGVYLKEGPLKGAKIAALGLKVKTNGCSYHGLAINVAMDLLPFTHIHPCGFENLVSVDMQKAGFHGEKEDVEKRFIQVLEEKLGEKAIWTEEFPSV